MRIDALAHLREALSALTTEASIYNPATDEEIALDPIERTIALDLERIDAALGQSGQSMFFPIAESIKGAVIEIVAAIKCLENSDAG